MWFSRSSYLCANSLYNICINKHGEPPRGPRQGQEEGSSCSSSATGQVMKVKYVWLEANYHAERTYWCLRIAWKAVKQDALAKSNVFSPSHHLFECRGDQTSGPIGKAFHRIASITSEVSLICTPYCHDPVPLMEEALTLPHQKPRFRSA